MPKFQDGIKYRVSRGKEANVVILYKAHSMSNKWMELVVRAEQSKATIVGVAERWVSESDHIPQNVANQCRIYREERGNSTLGSRATLLTKEGLVHRESEVNLNATNIHVFSLH